MSTIFYHPTQRVTSAIGSLLIVVAMLTSVAHALQSKSESKSQSQAKSETKLQTKAANVKPQTFAVDDSASVVIDTTPEMTWRSSLPSARDNAIIGRTRVHVRLNTTPWIGKSGSIYMLLPPMATSGSMKVTWRPQARFNEGSLAPGGRTLIYAGPIRDMRLEDVLDVSIEADGTRVSNSQQLRFHFEIDVE